VKGNQKCFKIKSVLLEKINHSDMCFTILISDFRGRVQEAWFMHLPYLGLYSQF